MTQSAAARGYGVVYPDPSAKPDLKAVAAADPAALGPLSQQYHTGLVLTGKLNGSQADWTLISGGAPQRWSDQAADACALLCDAGNALADHLGKQLNVVGTGGASGILWVSGLRSAQDYADLVAALRADPAVSQVFTQGALDDGVLFNVKATIPLGNLAANLAAGGLMLEGDPHQGADASLRWLH